MGKLSYTTGRDSNLVSFRSAARVPITSLKAHFKPKQDLHGYGQPWAGGAGKNKFGFTLADNIANGTNRTVTFTNDFIIINATDSVSTNAIITYYTMVDYCKTSLPSGTYTFSIQDFETNIDNISKSNIKIIFSDTNRTSSLDGESFTLSETSDILAINYNSVIRWIEGSYIKFHLQIEEGSSVTTWEPYENICPIEGWQGVEVYQDSVYSPNEYQKIIPITFPVLGKNKLNMDVPLNEDPLILNTKSTGWAYQTNNKRWINGNDYYLSNMVFGNNSFSFSTGNGNTYGVNYCLNLIANQTYSLSATMTNGKFNVTFFDINKESITRLVNINSFTVPSNAYYTFISCTPTEKNTNVSFNNIQLELGDTATEYEPYNPDNTVYGGYVDVVKGELVQEWVQRNLNDSTKWMKNGNILYYNQSLSYPRKKGSYINLYCSFIPTAHSLESGNPYIRWVSTTTSMPGFNINESVLTLEKVKELSDSGKAIMWYELETPIIYQLYPIQLQTFLNQNNIWSNTNSNTEISYAIYDTAPIRAAKHRIAANEPHIEVLAPATLQNFTTDMAAPLEECKIYFEPVQEGIGDPSSENIRNIYGWNSLNILSSSTNIPVVPINFSSGAIGDGIINYLGNDIFEFIGDFREKDQGAVIDIPIQPLTFQKEITYYFYAILSPYSGLNNDDDYAINFAFRGNNSNLLIFRPNIFGWDNRISTATALFPNDRTVDTLRIGVTKDNFNFKVQLFITLNPLTNILIPQINQNTVYGGYIDLVAGELINEWIAFDLGEQDYTFWDGNPDVDVYYFTVDNTNYNEPQTFCSCFKNVSTYTLNGIWTVGNPPHQVTRYLCCVPKNSFSSIEDFKTNYSGQKIIAKALSSTLYTLTPTQIKTLRGTNNICSNVNGPIELKYWTH